MRKLSDRTWLLGNAALIAALLVQGYFQTSARNFVIKGLLYGLAAIAATFVLWGVLERRFFRGSPSSQGSILSFATMIVIGFLCFLWTESHRAVAPYFYALCVFLGIDLWEWVARRYLGKGGESNK